MTWLNTLAKMFKLSSIIIGIKMTSEMRQDVVRGIQLRFGHM